MIGPLTLQVGKAVDKFISMLSSEILSKLEAGQQDIELTIGRLPLFAAAHAIYKGDKAHPKILWGNFWFLYYQAWLWKFSKEWRENVMEVWLKRLHDKGELEKLLTFYQVEND